MFEITIKNKGNKILGSLKVDSYFFEPSNYEYAFYLYKNDETFERKWYSDNMKVEFDIESNSGIFFIRCFIRDRRDKTKRGFNSLKISTNIGPYYVERWKKKVTKVTISEFEEDANIQDGIYQFDLNNNMIDFLFEGFDNFNQDKGLLVCFTGAVSSRPNKHAPFFSGFTIANQIGVPLISISDPSLAMSGNLALAWYAGNQEIKNLPENIANILDIICRKTKAKLTLFGGSGGGFAALSIANNMKNISNVVVWNPQTLISNYLALSVTEYLNTCFSDLPQKHNLYESLNESGVTHDLVAKFGLNKDRAFNILYLQNTGDELHMNFHAKQFMETLNAHQVNNHSYSTKYGITFWLKHWGNGHIMPSREIIIEALDQMLNEKSSLDIALSLN